MKIGYLVVAWSSPWIGETLRSIDTDSENLLVFDNKAHDWPLAKAWNHGIEHFCVNQDYDCVVICNDDIVLRVNTGEALWRALDEHDELLVISARHLGQEIVTPPTDLGVGTCDFGCFATTKRLLEVIGPFDEKLWPAYFEDNDMHYRVRLAGFECASAGFAPYFHHLNGTIRSDPVRAALVHARFPALQEYYIHKWGGLPHHETYTVPFNGGAGYTP